MSPASYLAAPPRVAVEIVAPSVTIVSDGLGDLRGADRRLSGGRGRDRVPRRAAPPGAGARSSGCAATSARSSTGSPTSTEQTAESAAARATDQPSSSRASRRLRVTLARFAVLRERASTRRPAHVRPLHRALPAQVRVAAVDLGTNTTRLLVADVVDGRVDEVHRETRITRLGEGVDARRRLLPVADRARAQRALRLPPHARERSAPSARSLVATSAVRDAENGEAFLGEIEWSYGFATRLVTGDEEAELTRRGVAARRRGRSSSTSAAARPSCSSTTST